MDICHTFHNMGLKWWLNTAKCHTVYQKSKTNLVPLHTAQNLVSTNTSRLPSLCMHPSTFSVFRKTMLCVPSINQKIVYQKRVFGKRTGYKRAINVQRGQTVLFNVHPDV